MNTLEECFNYNNFIMMYMRHLGEYDYDADDDDCEYDNKSEREQGNLIIKHNINYYKPANNHIDLNNKSNVKKQEEPERNKKEVKKTKFKPT